jgi:hypothetical protein
MVICTVLANCGVQLPFNTAGWFNQYPCYEPNLLGNIWFQNIKYIQQRNRSQDCMGISINRCYRLYIFWCNPRLLWLADPSPFPMIRWIYNGHNTYQIEMEHLVWHIIPAIQQCFPDTRRILGCPESGNPFLLDQTSSTVWITDLSREMVVVLLSWSYT